jgi:preprotein translocase subunit SecA
MNTQREVIYSLRRDILQGESIKEDIEEFIRDVLEREINRLLPEEEPELWEIEPLKDFLKEWTGREIPVPEVRDKEELIDKLYEEVKKAYREREKEIGSPEAMRELEKILLLNILDNLWREHLHVLDRVREGIYLRGYAQRDPLIEYKREAYELFEEMMHKIKLNTIEALFKVELKSPEEIEEERKAEEEKREKMLEGATFAGAEGKEDTSRKRLRPKTLKERMKAKKRKIK